MTAGLLLHLADVVLALHALLALFLTLGLAAIYVGGPLGWAWVRRRGWRIVHLAGLGVVAAEAVFGLACPLTEWENALRAAAGASGYRGGCVAHFLGAALFYDLDPRVFVVAYVLAFMAAAWGWRKWKAFDETRERGLRRGKAPRR